MHMYLPIAFNSDHFFKRNIYEVKLSFKSIHSQQFSPFINFFKRNGFTYTIKITMSLENTS